MFENINLKSINHKVPLTSSNYKSAIVDLGIETTPDLLDAFNSEFQISNTNQYVSPTLISDFARQNLLYLQAFALMHCDSSYYTRRKNFQSFLLLYTYEGSGILEYEGEVYRISEKEGFYIDCRKPHYYHTENSCWHHSDLHFNGVLADYFYKQFRKYNSVNFYSPFGGFYQALLEALLLDYITVSPYRELSVSNHIESIVLSILKEKERSSANPIIPDAFRKLITHMENNFTTPMTLDQLSDFANISKFHLSREFKQCTGFSPIDFLIELRISQAKFLLLNTNIAAYKIGQIVGIQDSNNFSKLFKRKTGVTPAEYRQLPNKSV